MSEVQKKAPTEVEQVQMSDGRVVGFAGKRKLIKDTSIEGGQASVRFDFRNGETRTFVVPQDLLLQFAAHGASQKIGDETAGEESVDDMVIAVETITERLARGEWGVTRKAGDSFSGASVVIRAICEVTGKSVGEIKDFLQAKLDAAEAKGEKLTRAALYASFRNPASRTGQVIERLEREKKSKTAVNADDLLGELA